MAKLKKGRIKVHICDTCHGNGYIRVAKIDGDPAVDLEIEAKSISVGTVIQRENFMKRLLMILLMTGPLTGCTKIKFDGYDPSTALVKWVFTNDTRN